MYRGKAGQVSKVIKDAGINIWTTYRDRYKKYYRVKVEAYNEADAKKMVQALKDAGLDVRYHSWVSYGYENTNYAAVVHFPN